MNNILIGTYIIISFFLVVIPYVLFTIQNHYIYNHKGRPEDHVYNSVKYLIREDTDHQDKLTIDELNRMNGYLSTALYASSGSFWTFMVFTYIRVFSSSNWIGDCSIFPIILVLFPIFHLFIFLGMNTLIVDWTGVAPNSKVSCGYNAMMKYRKFLIWSTITYYGTVAIIFLLISIIASFTHSTN